MSSRLLRVLPLLLCGLPLPVQSDMLSELPDPLAGRLQPVQEINLQHRDADSRAQLQQARSRVHDALASQREDSGLADGYGELGALYHVYKVERLAAACYDNAILLAPDEFRWVYYRARLAQESGELDKAEAGYLQARRLRPDYLATELRLADVWRELGEFDRAGAGYHALLDASGLQAAAHYGLGQIALLGHDPASAVTHFEQALSFQPDADRIHYPLAQALRASGDRQAAAQHAALMGETLPKVTDPLLESLASLKQGAAVHFIRAMKAYHRDDFEAARDDFAAGLKREPDNSNAHISHARSLYLCGERELARDGLLRALALTPHSALAHYLLGTLDEEEGNREAAAAHYAQAIDLEPGHAGAMLQLAHLNFRDGSLSRAASLYAQSLAADPANPAVYLPYAAALLRTGQNNGRALELIRQARQRFPDQVLYADIEIQLLATSDDPQQVQQALAEARARSGSQALPPQRELLALALAASGHTEEAAEVQQTLMAEMAWAMPEQAERLRQGLDAYREGRLPVRESLFTWTLLQPARLNGYGVFRNYPAARPY